MFSIGLTNEMKWKQLQPTADTEWHFVAKFSGRSAVLIKNVKWDFCSCSPTTGLGIDKVETRAKTQINCAKDILPKKSSSLTDKWKTKFQFYLSVYIHESWRGFSIFIKQKSSLKPRKSPWMSYQFFLYWKKSGVSNWQNGLSVKSCSHWESRRLWL